MFWAAHGLHWGVQRASLPDPKGLGNLFNTLRDWDRPLQLLVFNEEFLVDACHQHASITSLPFVHTARRSYRLDVSVSCSEETVKGSRLQLRPKFRKPKHLEEGEVVTRFP